MKVHDNDQEIEFKTILDEGEVELDMYSPEDIHPDDTVDLEKVIVSIKEEENGINIYIGSENAFDDNVTIIKAKYDAGGEEGTIALIGPKRMEYDRVISLLNYIMKNIQKQEVLWKKQI